MIMKAIRFLMLLIVATLSNMANAQVLPPPVFSEAPAKLRIILEDAANDVASIPIGVFCRTFFEDMSSPGIVINPEPISKGNSKYEAELNIGMTGESTIRMTFQKPGDETFTTADIIVILVPGETTTITYNGKKNTFQFDGPFKRLNSELVNYISRDGKYCYETLFGLHGDNATFLYDTTKPEDASILFHEKYIQAAKEIDSNKKLSAEFKEWWKCYIAFNVPAFTSDYVYFYCDKHPEYSADDSQGIQIWNDVNPVPGNAVFYLDRRMAINDVCRYYQNPIGVAPVQNEYVCRLCSAEQLRSRIEYGDSYIPESKLAEACHEIPEYESAIRKSMKKAEEEREAKLNMPTKGRLCELDRSLEGDAILTNLIAKYNNGKPTIITISKYCYFDSATYFKTYYKDKVNFVYIAGGEYADNEKFHDGMKEQEGDFYYLMKYQFNYLSKLYPYEYGNSTLIVSPDGKQIWHKEQIVETNMEEKLKEYLRE